MEQHKDIGTRKDLCLYRIQTAKDNLKATKYTAEALDTLITTLKDAGYTFVPLSQLIYRDKYHMDHEGRQIPN